MMFATLMLAALLSLIVFWQTTWLNIGGRIGKPADREQCQAARKMRAPRRSEVAPGCLNRFSASISGASAGVRLPSGGAAG